jgi:hypothetical protein
MGGACSTYGKKEIRIQGLGENLKERGHLEEPCLDGRIIVRQIFRKLDVGHGLGRSGSGYGQVEGTCDCGNEPSGSIICGKSLDWLRSG